MGGEGDQLSTSRGELLDFAAAGGSVISASGFVSGEMGPLFVTESTVSAFWLGGGGCACMVCNEASIFRR